MKEKKIKPSTQKRREKRAAERQAIKERLELLGLELGLVSAEEVDAAERSGLRAMRALLAQAEKAAEYEVGEGEAAAEAEAQAD